MLFTEPKSPVEYPTACGGKLREVGDHPSVEYRRRRVYFCRKACLRVYKTDPEQFMRGQISHPLEEEE